MAGESERWGWRQVLGSAGKRYWRVELLLSVADVRIGHDVAETATPWQWWKQQLRPPSPPQLQAELELTVLSAHWGVLLVRPAAEPDLVQAAAGWWRRLLWLRYSLQPAGMCSAASA